MPSRARNYEEEYVSFLERVSDELANAEMLADAESWREYVEEFILGRSGAELTEGQSGFIDDAFDYITEALSSGGFEFNPETHRFTDIETHQFVGRQTILDFLRGFGLFGGGT